MKKVFALIALFCATSLASFAQQADMPTIIVFPDDIWMNDHGFMNTFNNDGETEYMLTIPVIRRAAILETEPTSQEQSVITQTLAALNSAASTISASSSAAAQAALDAETYCGTTHQYMERTQEYKEAADAAYAQISTAIGSGYITLGSTQLTETQLIGLLKLIEED